MTAKKRATPGASSSSAKRKRVTMPSDPLLTKLGIPPEMQPLMRLIPGYDPVKTCENCRFDAAKARRALDFFPGYLKHVKGAKGGAPFELMLWQQAITANLFGWVRPDGSRRYRECFLYVPRKNGKTPWASGVILFTLLADDEPGAEIYSAATDRDQASLVFAHAKGMVLQDSELQQVLRIYDTARSIVFEQSMSSYKVISHEAGSKHGFNSHMVVIDELHAQPDRELVDVLTTSTGARRQPIILYCTTSDFERPSICNEKYAYACKVRDGILEDVHFLPVIYEAPRNWDGQIADYLTPEFYANEQIWQLANPNLGESLTWDYMRAECRRARETPAYLNTFLRLHLNIRTQADVAHYEMTQWDNCHDVTLDFDELRGHACWAGLDLAATSDLCALVLYFPDDDNAIRAFFWLPEETALVRERRNIVPYPAWVNQGFIKATEGNVADYGVIREDILACASLYDIRELAYDRWGATQLMNELQGEGMTVVGFGQGYASMSPPMKELDRLLAGRGVRHDGNPVARWCMSNVMAQRDPADNIKPSKAKSQEKIDFCV